MLLWLFTLALIIKSFKAIFIQVFAIPIHQYMEWILGTRSRCSNEINEIDCKTIIE